MSFLDILNALTEDGVEFVIVDVVTTRLRGSGYNQQTRVENTFRH